MCSRMTNLIDGSGLLVDSEAVQNVLSICSLVPHEWLRESYHYLIIFVCQLLEQILLTCTSKYELLLINLLHHTISDHK